jgi:hypothetical protein
MLHDQISEEWEVQHYRHRIKQNAVKVSRYTLTPGTNAISVLLLISCSPVKLHPIIIKMLPMALHEYTAHLDDCLPQLLSHLHELWVLEHATHCLHVLGGVKVCRVHARHSGHARHACHAWGHSWDATTSSSTSSSSSTSTSTLSTAHHGSHAFLQLLCKTHKRRVVGNLLCHLLD